MTEILEYFGFIADKKAAVVLGFIFSPGVPLFDKHEAHLAEIEKLDLAVLGTQTVSIALRSDSLSAFLQKATQ